MITMKKCKNCGFVMQDNCNFCSNCGSKDFETVYAPGSGMENDVYEYNGYGVDDEAKARKKKMYSMLGVLVIILLAILAVGAIKISIDSKAQKEAQAGNQTQQEETAFSYGEISGNVYRNKWADLRFAFDDNLKQAPKDSCEYIEDKSAVCDFNAVSADNKSRITVFLTDLSNRESLLNLSEADLLKEYSSKAAKRIEGSQLSDSQYQLIGNSLFMYADASGKTGGSDICVTTYLRKKDNYAIIISVSSAYPERNHKLADKFEPCE